MLPVLPCDAAGMTSFLNTSTCTPCICYLRKDNLVIKDINNLLYPMDGSTIRDILFTSNHVSVSNSTRQGSVSCLPTDYIRPQFLICIQSVGSHRYYQQCMQTRGSSTDIKLVSVILGYDKDYLNISGFMYYLINGVEVSYTQVYSM